MMNYQRVLDSVKLDAAKEYIVRIGGRARPGVLDRWLAERGAKCPS